MSQFGPQLVCVSMYLDFCFIVFVSSHDEERGARRGEQRVVCSGQSCDCMLTINKSRSDRSAPLRSTVSAQKPTGLI